MIRRGWMTGGRKLSWPRTSGDDPLGYTDSDITRLLAPHERG